MDKNIFENKHFLQEIDAEEISKTEQNIILGVFNEKSNVSDAINAVLIISKWVIWKERNILKYQSKQTSADKIVENIKKEIINISLMSKNEEFNALENVICN